MPTPQLNKIYYFLKVHTPNALHNCSESNNNALHNCPESNNICVKRLSCKMSAILQEKLPFWFNKVFQQLFVRYLQKYLT